jgi:hypothetical protein
MKLLEKIKEVFGKEHIEKCLSTTNEVIFFVLEQKKGQNAEVASEVEDEDIAFKVLNPQKKTLYFLAIDGGLIPSHNYEGTRADFALFSQDKFCLVELKTDSTSSSRVKKNIKKAYTQIKATLDYLKQEGIDTSAYTLEAYIVLPNGLHQAMRAPSETEDRFVEFTEEYNGSLFEKKNETEF